MNLDHIQIYRRRQSQSSLFTIKCIVSLPKIPKHIAFKAIADLSIRKKWDEILSDMTIVEVDELMDIVIFHYRIPTPAFI